MLTSNQSVGKLIKNLFENNEVKGLFFLMMLPDFMDNIINNLSSYNILKFSDIKPKMMDIVA